ncbi:hypothetical protein CQZ94_17545 [Bacillus sp. MYb209]|nr:hypothetical protein CQZ94_17545 [Bacillus sp. MYb209]
MAIYYLKVYILQYFKTSDRVSLLNPTTIQFSKVGDYRISFISSINTTVNYPPLSISYMLT